MATKAAPPTKSFPDDSIEKQVYNIVEKFKDQIPVINDRNRLSYYLFKYMNGEGDHPDISVKSSKINITGITHEELATRLSNELESVKK